jgi:adenylate cyclase
MAQEGVERRLAAILAADVVGYSRLMGADEAGTLARLKAHRRELTDPKIAEHHGRIVKTTGDGVLVEFPSVVNAVQCAVEIQREMARRNADAPKERRIEFRIGINLGDIIIDGDDIFGDGVNIAARLEGLAEPGGICISGDVHRQVRGKLEIGFDDTGGQQVKNIAEPVHVYRVLMDGVSLAEPPVSQQPVEFPPLREKPSIAVLPFDNMSGDQEQEYFADGITEDIITEISKLSGLLVISAFGDLAQLHLYLQGKGHQSPGCLSRPGRALHHGRERAQSR